MAHIHVEAAVILGAPREKVFEALTNEFYDWSVGRNAVSHKVVKKEGNAVYHEMVRKYLGIRVTSSWRDELTPPSKAVSLIASNMGEVTVVMSFDSESDGSTKVAGVFDGEVRGALAAVLGPFARRRLSGDMVKQGGKFAKCKGWDFRIVKAASE